jgi:hypothetical protein
MLSHMAATPAYRSVSTPSRGQLPHLLAAGMKRQRERLEAAGLVLQRARAACDRRFSFVSMRPYRIDVGAHPSRCAALRMAR